MRILILATLCLLVQLAWSTENLCKKENGELVHVSLVSIPLKGHINPLIGIGQQLAEMGCKVTFPIVKDKLSWVNFTGIEAIGIPERPESPKSLEVRRLLSKSFTIDMETLYALWDLKNYNPFMEFTQHCKDIVGHLLQERREGRYQPDIILTERMFEIFIDMADVFGAMPVVLNPGLMFDSDDVLHYVPMMLTGFPQEMSYFQRVINYFIVPQAMELLVALLDSSEELRAEFGFTGHPNLRPAHTGTFDGIELTQVIPDMDYVRPLLPLKHYVGPLLPLTLKPMPHHVELWLDSDPSDVVYFCVGTIVAISAETSAVVMEAVKDQPYRVLWSLPANQQDLLENLALPSNVRVEAFVPQREVLLHPKVKVFFSHTGASSANEAIKAGTPVVCMPYFGDQLMHCKRLVALGAALHLSSSSIDAETTRDAIWHALHNSTIITAARRLQKRTEELGNEKAATLLLSYYHDDHVDALLPYYIHLPWYQRNALDLSLTRFVFIITLPYTITWSYRLLRWALCICCCCCLTKKRSIALHTTKSKSE